MVKNLIFYFFKYLNFKLTLNIMDKPVPVPKWLVKGKTLELPDGNIVTFAGKNPRDHCIIVKDKNENIHVNFVIKEDEYELHLKNEKTGEKYSLFETYASVITDLTNHWRNKRSDLIKDFPSKYWKNHNEVVIDVNSSEIPMVRWKEWLYDADPETLRANFIPKEKIIGLKFSMGVMYDKYGNCQGMIMPIKKQKRLLLIKQPLFVQIMDTVFGIEFLRTHMKENYEKMKSMD